MKKLSFLVILSIILVSCGSSNDNFVLKGSVGASSSETAYAGSPAQFFVTITKVWLSENQDCSNPIVVKDLGENSETMDVMSNPTLLTAEVPSATYNCLIMQMYDTILFKTPTTLNNPGCHPHCQANTLYGMDTFRDPGEIFYDLENDTTIEAEGNTLLSNSLNTLTALENYSGRQLTTMFATTGNATDIQGAYSNLNYDSGVSHQVIQMTSPIIVTPDTTTVTLVVDHGDAIDGGGSWEDVCWVEEMTMGIQ